MGRKWKSSARSSIAQKGLLRAFSFSWYRKWFYSLQKPAVIPCLLFWFAFRICPAPGNCAVFQARA